MDPLLGVVVVVAVAAGVAVTALFIGACLVIARATDAFRGPAPRHGQVGAYSGDARILAPTHRSRHRVDSTVVDPNAFAGSQQRFAGPQQRNW